VSEQQGGGPAGSRVGGGRGRVRVLMSIRKAEEMSSGKKDKSELLLVGYVKGWVAFSSRCFPDSSCASQDTNVFSSVLLHNMLVTSCCALSSAISARAFASSCSVSANFSSKQATRSRCRARWRLWFSRTRFSVCSAETRDLRRDDAVSDAWSDEVEAGDVIDDIVGI
jgi:hypothetical protein